MIQIPIIDISGILAHVIAAVDASSLDTPTKTYADVLLRDYQPLKGTPDPTVRIQIFDDSAMYLSSSVNARRVSFEVAQIPTPL